MLGSHLCTGASSSLKAFLATSLEKFLLVIHLGASVSLVPQAITLLGLCGGIIVVLFNVSFLSLTLK